MMELEAIIPACESVYVPKACDELEPLLALWPHVLALPTIKNLSRRELIRIRAFPAHIGKASLFEVGAAHSRAREHRPAQ